MNGPDVFALALSRISTPQPPACPPGELQLTLHPDWLTDSLVCRFDFQDEEKMTNDDPGCSASMDLLSAWLGTVDIAAALGDEQREALEELAVEELAIQRENAAIDAYESRRDDE